MCRIWLNPECDVSCIETYDQIGIKIVIGYYFAAVNDWIFVPMFTVHILNELFMVF